MVPGRASAAGAWTGIGLFVNRFFKVPGACQTLYVARHNKHQGDNWLVTVYPGLWGHQHPGEPGREGGPWSPPQWNLGTHGRLVCWLILVLV